MSIVNVVNGSILPVAEAFEGACQILKDFPQYKYLTRPVYKAFVDKTGPVFATMISFFTAEVLAHQMPIHVVRYVALYYGHDSSPEGKARLREINWYSKASAILWTCIAAMVSYAKYNRT
jgi:hypothetical protein